MYLQGKSSSKLYVHIIIITLCWKIFFKQNHIIVYNGMYKL